MTVIYRVTAKLCQYILRVYSNTKCYININHLELPRQFHATKLLCMDNFKKEKYIK